MIRYEMKELLHNPLNLYYNNKYNLISLCGYQDGYAVASLISRQISQDIRYT